jgi:DNA-binding CsgD family transcriptional regulator
VTQPTLHELRVLELTALGLSSREIATRLWITRHTVTYHLGNLFAKFLVQGRSALVARAYALGVLAPGTWPPRLSPTYQRYVALLEPRGADPAAGSADP